jgi:hypothetical protein
MIYIRGVATSGRTAITRSRGGNYALANLLKELATKKFIANSTTL